MLAEVAEVAERRATALVVAVAVAAVAAAVKRDDVRRYGITGSRGECGAVRGTYTPGAHDNACRRGPDTSNAPPPPTLRCRNVFAGWPTRLVP
ncbi:hypothetical protein Sliba_37430 [Streptomyces nigrescens]|uniref:Uncharacterized protein n=1 Tax=Streptomyces nigrescens TaxID=1920 RepID=A0A640TJA0_STRNI|nr:hypothetical protein Sliba_37430 [Streptomyces libani subsp. libani]GGV92597.1 hypothetical protein GCM10010500_26130 [Streptomyces libani subsp. libani]